MPVTYQLISSNVLSSSAASVTFSSIPATYTDLVLRCSVRNSAASTQADLWVTFNSSTSYSYRNLRGNGASASSIGGTDTVLPAGQSIVGSTATASTFSSIELYIPSYTANQNKPVSIISATENNATTAWSVVTAGLNSMTAAITSVVFSQTGATTFDSGSSFYLYGIKNS
jgi:hypothetical protein